jgi:hypothetical protein
VPDETYFVTVVVATFALFEDRMALDTFVHYNVWHDNSTEQ